MIGLNRGKQEGAVQCVNTLNSRDYPLVSIGIPLFNEARFVKDSLGSILAQDYPNLEIIISDNASTDGTLSICQSLTGERIDVLLHRFDENEGAAENFRYVLNASKGKYFMWASGHDLWAPNYISENVELLETVPTAVVAFGASVWIDEDGQKIPRYFGYTDTRGMTSVARFFTIFWGNMHPVLGLIRKSALDKTRPMVNAVGTDLILLSQLALQGDFIHALGTLWQRREFRKETTHADKMKRYRSAECGLTRSFLGKSFPLLRMPIELARSILQGELSAIEKIAVLIALMASLPIRYISGKK